MSVLGQLSEQSDVIDMLKRNVTPPLEVSECTEAKSLTSAAPERSSIETVKTMASDLMSQQQFWKGGTKPIIMLQT